MEFEHQGLRKRHSPRVGKEFSGQRHQFWRGPGRNAERVRELGGELDIRSKTPGTLISVTMLEAVPAADASAAD
jgi:signal transduction histidine kinase